MTRPLGNAELRAAILERVDARLTEEGIPESAWGGTPTEGDRYSGLVPLSRRPYLRPDVELVPLTAPAADPTYPVAGIVPHLYGPDRCCLCKTLGEPLWTGRAPIEGRTMRAHRHLNPTVAA